MQVLRGWRLLQTANLSPAETRDILSSTQQRLTFEAISGALQSLLGEQLLGQRYQLAMAIACLSTGSELARDRPCGGDWSGWNDEHWHAEAAEETLEEGEQLKEALQGEKAAEAKRTWSEAQRMTQQMRKDRGFGKGSGGVKRFNFGGSHFARDCPDERHPSFPGKGKVKQHYMVDTMDGMFQAKGKGKSKHGKGKSKSATWVDEADAMWSLKGKGNFAKRPSVTYVYCETLKFIIHYGRLTGVQKQLFDRAKAKEVGSFLSNEAVRKCINDEEAREAMSSGKSI